MWVGPNMIKEYTCLPRSLAAAQSLQNWFWRFSNGSSSNHREHTKQHEHIQENNGNKLNQYTNQWKTEVKHLKIGSMRYNDRNGTKNA